MPRVYNYDKKDDKKKDNHVTVAKLVFSYLRKISIMDAQRRRKKNAMHSFRRTHIMRKRPHPGR